MVALISVLLGEEARRRVEGRADAVIPMRPDHGHLLLDDIGKQTNPAIPPSDGSRGWPSAASNALCVARIRGKDQHDDGFHRQDRRGHG